MKTSKSAKALHHYEILHILIINLQLQMNTTKFTFTGSIHTKNLQHEARRPWRIMLMKFIPVDFVL